MSPMTSSRRFRSHAAPHHLLATSLPLLFLLSLRMDAVPLPDSSPHLLPPLSSEPSLLQSQPFPSISASLPKQASSSRLSSSESIDPLRTCRLSNVCFNTSTILLFGAAKSLDFTTKLQVGDRFNYHCSGYNCRCYPMASLAFDFLPPKEAKRFNFRTDARPLLVSLWPKHRPQFGHHLSKMLFAWQLLLSGHIPRATHVAFVAQPNIEYHGLLQVVHSQLLRQAPLLDSEVAAVSNHTIKNMNGDDSISTSDSSLFEPRDSTETDTREELSAIATTTTISATATTVPSTPHLAGMSGMRCFRELYINKQEEMVSYSQYTINVVRREFEKVFGKDYLTRFGKRLNLRSASACPLASTTADPRRRRRESRMQQPSAQGPHPQEHGNLTLTTPNKGWRKAVIMQRGEGSGRRDFENLQEVKDFLQQVPWPAFNEVQVLTVASDTSILDIIQAISTAQLVLAPHGSHLKNLIFARRFTTAVEVRINEFYRTMSPGMLQLEVDFHYSQGHGKGACPKRLGMKNKGIYCNVVVNIHLLSGVLRKAERTQRDMCVKESEGLGKK